MSEPTQLIISIQGKRGAGKTTLAEQVIAWAMAAIGATQQKATDSEKGVFLTYLVPFGFADRVLFFTRGQVDEIVKNALGYERQAASRRIGFHNASEVTELLRKRQALYEFLIGDDDGDVPRKIAAHVMPWPLTTLEPARLIALLRQDAHDGLVDIDNRLEKLGFDTSGTPELPAR